MSAAVSALAATTDLPSTPVAGRHRQVVSAADRWARTVDLVGRLGSFVAMTALLVVGGAAAGVVDGVPVTGDAAVTVTYEGTGR